MRQLMHSFTGLRAPADILVGVERGQISSFCLFAYMNVETPAQLRELSEALRHAAAKGGNPPPLIGIDQEGGQLIAITGGATELPGNMALGATRSVALAEKAGRVLARELLAMGMNMNFAPSVDVNINPANPVIGLRSFGDEPEVVSALGIGMIHGMQAEGLIATAKHFPGHGDTGADTHHGDAIIPYDSERIHRVELAPFREAIKAGVDAIMSAHIRVTTLDPDWPATMSRKILTDLLRRELGFDGLVITDAMDMWAVARHGKEESIQAALDAGADLILLGHIKGQMELMTRFTENAASVARINAVRQKLATTLPAFDVVGCAEHQAIAREIAEASITRVKGDVRLNPADDAHILVITPYPENLTPADTSATVKIKLAEAISKRHPHTTHMQIPMGAADVAAIVQVAESADTVIVGTINAYRDATQAALVNELQARGKRPIVIALRAPYDLVEFPSIENYLCTYSIRPVSMEAVARVLFGEIEARGVLPCKIPQERF
ncbi:MAG: glycoside hydrolase family 3 protein [Anaerolineae bacterium]|nr:glycoside hydrolase family 3 protein [Anaerolineae bacterium]